MKLKFIILIALSIAFLSCTKDKNELTEAKKINLNKTVDSVFNIHENNRHSLNAIDKKFGLNRNTFSKSESLKRERMDSLTYPKYQKAIDSIFSVIKVNDSLNAKLLIKLTKNYGFLNNRRLGTKRSKAYLIFAHAPKYYFPEIKNLIDSEYKAGRMIAFKKEYILWHTNGRKGLPPMCGAKGEAIWN